MKLQSPWKELLNHLTQSGQISDARADKLLQEVFAYFDETAEQFVQRRHQELQGTGLKNPQIFREIQSELQFRRFPAPRYSDRQLRRLVYG